MSEKPINWYHKTLLFMKNIKIFCLLFLVGALLACSNSLKSDGVDYFSKSDIKIPKFSDETINNHLNEYKNLYNLVLTSVTSNAKDNAPQLSISFSDWAITSLKIEDKLKGQEKKDYLALLDVLAKKWNEQRDKLY